MYFEQIIVFYFASAFYFTVVRIVIIQDDLKQFLIAYEMHSNFKLMQILILLS